jgi:hypothetical protein
MGFTGGHLDVVVKDPVRDSYALGNDYLYDDGRKPVSDAVKRVERAERRKLTRELVRYLKGLGLNVGNLRAAGLGDETLGAVGLGVESLKSVGLDADDLEVAGDSADDLEVAGDSADDLEVAGDSADDLEVAGDSADDLEVAGGSGDDLEVAGLGDGGCLNREGHAYLERRVLHAQDLYREGAEAPGAGVVKEGSAPFRGEPAKFAKAAARADWRRVDRDGIPSVYIRGEASLAENLRRARNLD